jgi:hypothetical protein
MRAPKDAFIQQNPTHVSARRFAVVKRRAGIHGLDELYPCRAGAAAWPLMARAQQFAVPDHEPDAQAGRAKERNTLAGNAKLRPIKPTSPSRLPAQLSAAMMVKAKLDIR